MRPDGRSAFRVEAEMTDASPAGGEIRPTESKSKPSLAEVSVAFRPSAVSERCARKA